MQPGSASPGEAEFGRFRGGRGFGHFRHFGGRFGRRGGAGWHHWLHRGLGGLGFPQPPMPDGDDADGGDSGDAGEGEYPRRRRHHRGHHGRRGRRRHRWSFLRSSSGQWPPPLTDDDDDDDDDNGESQELAGETEGEFRGFRNRFGFRGGFRGGFRPGFGFRQNRGRVARPFHWAHNLWRGGFRRPLFGAPFRRPFGRFFRPGWPGFRPGIGVRWPWLHHRRHHPHFGFGVSAPVGFAPPPPPPIDIPAPAPVPLAPGGDAASPWVAAAQFCLAKIFGEKVPRNGVLGPETRQFVQTFQQQRGLPATGMLDSDTMQAIQLTCGAGDVAAPMTMAPPPDAGPPPDAAAAPPDDAAAGAAGADAAAAQAAPDAAAAGADAAPEPAQNEVLLGRRDERTQQEFQVTAPITANLQQGGPVAINGDLSRLPDSGAVYIITEGGRPWYVGAAETSLRHRFLQRVKALSDLHIPVPPDRSVVWYALQNGGAAAGNIRRRPANNPNAPFQTLPGRNAILKVVEQHFIRVLNPPGNRVRETVLFDPKGSLTVAIAGQSPVTRKTSF